MTHLLTGWAVASSLPLGRRDRAIVTIGGIIPDLDGLGIIAEQLTWNWERPYYWYSEYHHVLGHNIGFASLVMVISAVAARRRIVTALLTGVSFHLHLLGDLVGSRGPFGYQWPIPYLQPFSERWQLTWSGQWELNAWPNIAFTLILLAWMFYWAWRRGQSPLELIPGRANEVFVSALRSRFGDPSLAGNSSIGREDV